MKVNKKHSAESRVHLMLTMGANEIKAVNLSGSTDECKKPTQRVGFFVLFRSVESFAFIKGEIKQKIACEAWYFSIMTLG